MTEPQERAVIGQRGVTSVAASAVLAALSGYVVLVLVARDLSPALNADFLVFWSLLFGLFGVLGGVQQEATRAVGSAELDPASVGRSRVLPWSLVVGAGVAVVVAATSVWWRSALLGGTSNGVALVALSLSMLLFSGHAASVGTLAGLRRWGTSSVLVAGEAMVRVVLVAAAVLAGAELVGLEVAAVAGEAFWLVVLVFSATARRAARARANAAPPRLLGRMLQTMLASTGAAVLVVGFPSLLRATTDAREWAHAAPLVLSISMTRAPLLMPLNAFQGVAISYFLDPTRRRAAALVRVVAAILVAGLLGATVAALVGPALMALFFGPDYRVSASLLFGLTLAAAALAILTMTGSAVLALGRHVAYAVGWTVAAATSVALLLVDLPLSARAVLALAVGPLVGVIVHVTGVPELRAVRAMPAATATGQG